MAIVNIFLDKNSRPYVPADAGPQYLPAGEETAVGEVSVFIQYTKTGVLCKLDGNEATVTIKQDVRGKSYMQCTTNSASDTTPMPAALKKLLGL